MTTKLIQGVIPETTTASDSRPVTVIANAPWASSVSDAFMRQYAHKSFRDDWWPRQMSAALSMQIREMRLARGWSQQELARRSGIAQGQISRLESGLHDGTITTYQRLARVFDCAFMIRFCSHSEGLAWILAVTVDGASMVPASYDEDAALITQ